MLLFEKILVPLDSSEHSKKALEKAVQIANKFDNIQYYEFPIDDEDSVDIITPAKKAYEIIEKNDDKNVALQLIKIKAATANLIV